MRGDQELSIGSGGRRPSQGPRRWVLIVLSLVLVAAGGYLLFLPSHTGHRGAVSLDRSGGAPSDLIEESTLRNLTGKSVSYTILPGPDVRTPRYRTLENGRLDRIVAESPFTITYHNGSHLAEYVVFPGRPYCFRLDNKGLVMVYPGSHKREDAADLAPYLPSPPEVVKKMISMGRVGPSDVVYDIGCGDGRIVIAAASEAGALGVGIEIDPALIERCKENAHKAGVESRVRFICMDATRAHYVEASVIMVYLLPESLEVLEPLLLRDLKDGTRIVSHNYRIPGWDERIVRSESIKDKNGRTHTIYLYKFERRP